MFRALPFPPLTSPPGSCTITVRSLMGTDLYVEAWLAADVSLMKEALMAVFRCSAEQMRFFLPDGLLARSPLSDRTWIRCLPVIGNTRLVYLVVMDDVPKRVRICLPRGDAQSSPCGATGLVSVCFTNTPLSNKVPLSDEVSL